MPHNLDKMVLRAKLKSLQHKKEFIEKWKDSPSAFPQGGAVPTEQGQPFNQSENPAQGGISAEGRTPGVSGRVGATGQDSSGNDA